MGETKFFWPDNLYQCCNFHFSVQLKYYYLTQADKDSAHGLEVESLVTVEDQHESAKLVTKGLHRLCFPSSGWTCTTKQILQIYVNNTREGSLYRSLLIQGSRLTKTVEKQIKS